MASYGLEERFKTPNDCFRLTDPTAYDTRTTYKIKRNKYGFLSTAPRKTQCWRKPYTENIYDTTIPHSIPNVTSLKSKTPRFSFEPFNEEVLDKILCTCAMENRNACECPVVPEVPCQAKVPKSLFKGPPPHSLIGEGLSVPCKRDHGFEILFDGTSRRLMHIVKEECPPFYDTRVTHSPEYFRGCKWSHWKASRSAKPLEVRPGPADYYIEREKTLNELCAEKVRENRRKTSRQLRFVEALQNRNIWEGRPGPADYTPQSPKGTNLEYLGPKTKRFPLSTYEPRPSPACYSIKRDFDLIKPPEQRCLAKLPPPACFGIKAQRFKRCVQVGPSPADYDASVKICRVVNCSKVPFGCSAVRFAEKVLHYEDEGDENLIEEEETKTCPKLTYQFKSKTERFRSTKVEYDPFLVYRTNPKPERTAWLQALSPFLTSQGRFQPWFDWLPLHAGLDVPGPGVYDAMKARCTPAVKSGPLYRAQRFRSNMLLTPAPNEYRVGRGLETAFKTHNLRLRKCIQQKSQQLKYKWKPPVEPRHLTPEEREVNILNKAIMQLEVNEEKSIRPGDGPSLVVLKEVVEAQSDSKRASAEERDTRTRHSSDRAVLRVIKRLDVLKKSTTTNVVKDESKETKKEPTEPNQKLLRTFLYKHPMPVYF